MADDRAQRAKSCLYGLAAIPMVWIAATAAAFPLTTDLAVAAPQGWDRMSAAELLIYIERIDSHGLEPADYEPEELSRAIRLGDDGELERQADESFGLVAHDLTNGHVRPGQRRRFYIATEPLESAEIARLIDHALASSNVVGTLDGLAPRTDQYTALRAALGELPASSSAERRKIEASLERWRWMPHEIGEQHLLVNIPEYRLHVLADGKEVASHRVIVGKPQTPTPQFSAEVTGVVFNPSWHVPQSIVAESVGALVRNNPQVARARGYTWSYSGGGLQVTQQPGPGNALGEMKIDMPNPFTVYLHDTSNRELFDRDQRALSHGCIRTDKPFDLARLLLGGTDWTPARIDEVVASRKTTRVALERPMPVYTVYMTAYAAPDGTVSYFDDPYSFDQAINRLLDDRARS